MTIKINNKAFTYLASRPINLSRLDKFLYQIGLELVHSTELISEVESKLSSLFKCNIVKLDDKTLEFYLELSLGDTNKCLYVFTLNNHNNTRQSEIFTSINGVDNYPMLKFFADVQGVVYVQLIDRHKLIPVGSMGNIHVSRMGLTDLIRISVLDTLGNNLGSVVVKYTYP